jgi:CHASE3 domain sensor protein
MKLVLSDEAPPAALASGLGGECAGRGPSGTTNGVGSGPAQPGSEWLVAMRLRIPPLLPTYFLLVLVVLFAAGSLWIGLDRLAAIERLADSRADSAMTVQDLQSLRTLVADIVNSTQAYLHTADTADIEVFERARRGMSAQLTSLRDHMRDSPEELALVERLVPLIARTAALAGATIDRARGGPEGALGPEATTDYRSAITAIQSIIAELEARERDQVARDGRALLAVMGTARLLQYALAVLVVLLAALLFFAARRLSSFIPPVVRADAATAIALDDGASPQASNDRIVMLLEDALARARLAAELVSENDPAAGARLRQSIAAVERAPLATNLEVPRQGAPNVAEGLTLLAREYSQPGRMTVAPVLDQSVEISGRDKRYVVDRVAQWGLEVVATRKRGGEVSLSLSASDQDGSLRILALLDHPDQPLQLSPKEREEADFLRRAAAALGGRFVVNVAPTGFALVLTVPLDT